MNLDVFTLLHLKFDLGIIETVHQRSVLNIEDGFDFFHFNELFPVFFLPLSRAELAPFGRAARGNEQLALGTAGDDPPAAVIHGVHQGQDGGLLVPEINIMGAQEI